MPDTSQTGFAIMCDWPGMDDATCCCPIPDSKVVDVISTWEAALEELNDRIKLDRDTARTVKNQRNILFTYKRRCASFRDKFHLVAWKECSIMDSKPKFTHSQLAHCELCSTLRFALTSYDYRPLSFLHKG